MYSTHQYKGIICPANLMVPAGLNKYHSTLGRIYQYTNLFKFTLDSNISTITANTYIWQTSQNQIISPAFLILPHTMASGSRWGRPSPPCSKFGRRWDCTCDSYLSSKQTHTITIVVSGMTPRPKYKLVSMLKHYGPTGILLLGWDILKCVGLLLGLASW